jgi:hypothetical protein
MLSEDLINPMAVLSRSKKRSTTTNPYRHREPYPFPHPHDTAPPRSAQGIASPLLVAGISFIPSLRASRRQSNGTSFDRSTVKVSKHYIALGAAPSEQSKELGFPPPPPPFGSNRLSPSCLLARVHSHRHRVIGRPRRGFDREL